MYVPPPTAYAVPLARTQWATPALLFALVGIFVSWCSLGALSIVAVIMGHAARRDVRQHPGLRGDETAVAALLFGYLGVLSGVGVAIGAIVNAAVHG